MKIAAYKFKGINDLYCDMSGTFFFKGEKAPKVFNNGSISVLCGKSKRGIIKLRKLSYLSEIEIIECPF